MTGTHRPALRCAIAAMLLLVAGSALAGPKTNVDPLPPEVVKGDETPEYSQNTFKRFRSEPLWTADALKGHSARYRFTYWGILTHSLQVRIDISLKGKAVLHAKVLRHGREIERQTRVLSGRELSEFRKLADESGLWSGYPEFWVLKDPDDICLDGMEAAVEKLDAAGYRFSMGNTSCTSPKGMNLLIDKMAALARLDSEVRWFPWSDRVR